MKRAQIEAVWKEIQAKSDELTKAASGVLTEELLKLDPVRTQVYEANRALEIVLFRLSNVMAAAAAHSEEAVEEAAANAINDGKVIMFPEGGADGAKAAE